MTNSEEVEPLVLNSKGQCPHCEIKPLVYKRTKHYFCHRCDRQYSLDTKIQMPNWAYPDGITRKTRADKEMK